MKDKEVEATEETVMPEWTREADRHPKSEWLCRGIVDPTLVGGTVGLGGLPLSTVKLAHRLYKDRKPLEFVYKLLVDVDLLDGEKTSLEDLYYLVKEYRSSTLPNQTNQPSKLNSLAVELPKGKP